MAEGVRFELTAPSRESPVFKTGSLNRSDIPPNRTGYTIRSTLTSATHIFYHISRRLSRGFPKKKKKYYVTIPIWFFARLDYAIPRSHFSISATSSSRCIQCSATGITVISALFSSANLLTVSNGTTSSFSPQRIWTGNEVLTGCSFAYVRYSHDSGCPPGTSITRSRSSLSSSTLFAAITPFIIDTMSTSGDTARHFSTTTSPAPAASREKYVPTLVVLSDTPAYLFIKPAERRAYLRHDLPRDELLPVVSSAVLRQVDGEHVIPGARHNARETFCLILVPEQPVNEKIRLFRLVAVKHGGRAADLRLSYFHCRFTRSAA